MSDNSRSQGQEPSSTQDNAAAATQEAAPAARQANDFPIVVVGASAGGLQPLKEFFEAVPEDPGMAFLVVQHRKADAESMLTELLGRESTLQVADATDGLAPERNHVYVMPASQRALLHNGVLAFHEPESAHRQPIDYLLRAVAADVGSRAVAVILSGTGTDGTLGVRAVRAEDGYVAVQDPQTTEYQGMPKSAIDTGEVDVVLPVAEIPQRLVEYAHTTRHLRDGAGQRSTGPNEELSQLIRMLRERSGHDFSMYKTSTVTRRIERRIAVHSLSSYGEYLGMLREDPRELDVLYRELLIRVSGFFRDPEAFAALQEKVIPELIKRAQPQQPIRVWVPGCATGEEAYSLAMLFDERIRNAGHSTGIQVFATDIDTSSLAYARAGRYPASIAMDLSSERLKRYFRTSDNYYEVEKRLREKVVFAEQSVIKDPPFSSLDLISCRNLLIYLQGELQKQLLPLFHYALRPSGYLFLGPSESVVDSDTMFHTLDRKAKIYQRRNDPVAQSQQVQPLFPATGSVGKGQRQSANRGPARSIGEVTERVLLREHLPPCVMLDGQNTIVYFSGATGQFLEPASGTPTLDIMQMVQRDLAYELRIAIRRLRYDKQDTATASAEVSRENGTRVRLFVSRVADAEAPAEALLVTFEVLGSSVGSASGTAVSAESEEGERVQLLERELSETRQDLRATVEELETSNEELQSSNEELVSSNEELQSSNEELETSREELQSVNEELHTVNAELESKVEELSSAQDDIDNLLASTDIGMIFLDPDLRIKRFTPAVQSLLPVLDADFGRPLSHFSSELTSPRVRASLENVLKTGEDREQAETTEDGRRYLVRIRPYRTSRDRVAGAVLAFVPLPEGTELNATSFFNWLVEACPGMVLLIDRAGMVVEVNAALAEATGYTNGELADTPLDELLSGGDTLGGDALVSALDAAVPWRETPQCRAKHGPGMAVTAWLLPLASETGQPSHALVQLQGRAE